MNHPDKGLYLGRCNRTDCQRPPATFFNQSTVKYYCPSCAELLNDFTAAQPECIDLFGTTSICVERYSADTSYVRIQSLIQNDLVKSEVILMSDALAKILRAQRKTLSVGMIATLHSLCAQRLIEIEAGDKVRIRYNACRYYTTEPFMTMLKWLDSDLTELSKITQKTN